MESRGIGTFVRQAAFVIGRSDLREVAIGRPITMPMGNRQAARRHSPAVTDEWNEEGTEGCAERKP